MDKSSSGWRKVLIALYLLAIHSLAALFVYQNLVRPYFNRTENYARNIEDPTERVSVPTPLPLPPAESPVASPTEIDANQTQPDAANNSSNAFSDFSLPNNQNNQTAESPAALMIPVVGVKREQLQDTFNDARSEGRVHNATDIIAPLGTPVVAAADGEITKFFDSERGGITVYQLSVDQKTVYYYAHLQRRADNLREKDFVRRGTIIGYVGDTGNAGAGNYHLHFTVGILRDPKRFWDSDDINPYPLLKVGIEAK